MIDIHASIWRQKFSNGKPPRPRPVSAYDQRGSAKEQEPNCFYCLDDWGPELKQSIEATSLSLGAINKAHGSRLSLHNNPLICPLPDLSIPVMQIKDAAGIMEHKQSKRVITNT
jgi:hypothetical protein